MDFVYRLLLKDNTKSGFRERISSRPQGKNTVKTYSAGAERQSFPHTLRLNYYSFVLVGLIIASFNRFSFGS
jgi:hypothetical protein